MKNCIQKKLNKKGFSLVEVMIVIAIIAILITIAIPNFIEFRAKSFCTSVESDARTIVAHLIDYFSVPGRTDYEQNNFASTVVFYGDQAVKLSPGNRAKVVKASGGSEPKFIITVADGQERCPAEYRERNPRWSNGMKWEYTLTI